MKLQAIHIEEKVSLYPTKHKEGFIKSEIDLLLSELDNINIKEFDNALNDVTCIVKGKDIVTFNNDIIKALFKSIEK